jgi:hypothetical protein
MNATMLLLLASLSIAQAAEPRGTLTLACEGRVTIESGLSEYDPVSISMWGVIINLTNHTVKGTSHRGPYLFDDQLPIIEANEGTIAFRGFSNWLGMTVNGSIDRVTGDVGMLATARAQTFYYSLKCKPTQRMF